MQQSFPEWMGSGHNQVLKSHDFGKAVPCWCSHWLNICRVSTTKKLSQTLFRVREGLGPRLGSIDGHIKVGVSHVTVLVGW